MTGSTDKLHSLPTFDKIPLPAVTVIGDIITVEEGGWIVGSEPDGSDGGWTYGGMTAREYHEYDPSVTKAEIEKWDADKVDKTGITQLKQTIYRIYYQDYYLEAAKLITPILPQAYHLSCIINCGPSGFKDVLKDVNTKGNQAIARSQFLAAWKERYFRIVRDNPEKAVYIHGWINRVWKYL